MAVHMRSDVKPVFLDKLFLGGFAKRRWVFGCGSGKHCHNVLKIKHDKHEKVSKSNFYLYYIVLSRFFIQFAICD